MLSRPFEKPLISCERITPEFPLAPLRDPLAAASITSVTFTILFLAISLAAEVIVKDIFVPVSPSGTGNTLSESISCLFSSNLLAPAINIFLRVRLFILFCATIFFLPIKHQFLRPQQKR